MAHCTSPTRTTNMTSSIPAQPESSSLEMNGKHRPDELVDGGSAMKKARLGAGGKELPELYKWVLFLLSQSIWMRRLP